MAEARLTKLFPVVQFKKKTWEIDEFDCASMFLLEGAEKAMLVDCGMGVGDLRGAVEMLTDKPLVVVLTHAHPDHVGNAPQFEEVWLHPKDRGMMQAVSGVERRRYDTECIAQRNKGRIGPPYTLFHLYPYDINVDLREPDYGAKGPVVHDLVDGQKFDLGGGRVVTVYETPGHTAGEVVLVDEQTGTLIAGDAINFNLFASACAVETTLNSLKRIRELAASCDGIWNGHHDFRAQGAPLDDDCLPTAIEMCEEALKGNVSPIRVPNPWGQALPLTRVPEANKAPKIPGMGPKPGSRPVTLQRGRNVMGIDLSYLREP